MLTRRCPSRFYLALSLAFALTAATASAQPALVELPPEPQAPTLARVIALARERSEQAVLARADLEVARSTFTGARLAPLGNPYLEIQAGRGTVGTKDVAIQGLLSLPVEIAGQRGRRIAEAGALVGWQEAIGDAARAMAAAEAVRALGTLAVTVERVRTIESTVASSRAEADLQSARLDAGDATQRDAKLARLDLARNEVHLAETRADLARSLAELYRVTGTRFAELPTSADPPAPTGGAPTARAAARAPEVRALAQQANYHAHTRERLVREAVPPLSIIATAGRGDLGEARFGGGVGFTLPVARAYEGERARADAERLRALTARDARARAAEIMLAGLHAERTEVAKALAELDATARPAARAAVEAAVATERAGKGDLLTVLTARRDLAALEERRLDLIQRAWTLLSEIVAITGDLP